MYVLVDTSVFMHLIHNKSVKISHLLDSPERLKGWLTAQLAVFIGAEWLGTLRENDNHFIFLCDSKPYWRLAYLEQRGITYKGGRKPAADTYVMIAKAVRSILSEKNYGQWTIRGYEADDLAALFCVQSEGRKVLLATVDKDWRGLIDENISWFSLVQYKNQAPYRYCNSLDSLNAWLKYKQMPAVDHPSQLWERLSQYGDESDGLPRGCNVDVIDLLNPPEQYRLWDRLKVNWDSGKPVSPEQCDRAHQWLLENYFEPIISPYTCTL